MTSAAVGCWVYRKSFASWWRPALRGQLGPCARVRRTHWEDNVAKVHGNEDCVPDASPVEHVTKRDEECRDEVVGEHLAMVFPSRLQV